MSSVTDTTAVRCGVAALVVACAPLCVTVAHAHSIIATAPSDRADNSAIVGGMIGLAALGYGVGLRRLWSRGPRGHREAALRAAAFGGGLAAVGLALLSPLDRWGTQLFALHMIQHAILMLVGAPLLVAG